MTPLSDFSKRRKVDNPGSSVCYNRSMDLEAITALVVAVGGLLGIIYKMWHDHTVLAQSQQVLTEQVLTVVEKNAIANTKLQGSVDNFSILLIRLVDKPKKR